MAHHKELTEHLTHYREMVPGISEAGGFNHKGKAIAKGYILPTELRWLNILPGVREQVQAYVAATRWRPSWDRWCGRLHADLLHPGRVACQPPRVDTLVDTFRYSAAGCSATPPEPTVALGVPFGPFALWNDAQPTAIAVAFTGSQNYTSPQNVFAMIANRARRRAAQLAIPQCAAVPLSGGMLRSRRNRLG